MAWHDAFISYSRHDKGFAARLERRLEKYKAPKALPVRQGYLDVFRDEADFTGADYHASLARHLEESATLVVLCSPSARASEYVNDEIRRFVALKGADRLVPVLVSGIPNNEATPEREAEKAFPEALCEALPMPLAANYLGFDPAADRVDRGAYLDAWFTVLANIYRVSRSEIEQRERKRRARFISMAVSVTGSIVALLVVALVVTLLSRAEAVRQAIEARRETSTRLAVQAMEKIKGAPETALGLAIAAVETYLAHGDPPVSRALEALHRARLAFGGGRPVLPWRADQAALVFSSDLVWAASGSDSGEVRFTRSGSGDVTMLAPPPLHEPGETWVAEAPALLFTRGRLVAGRRIQRAGERSPGPAVLWYWPLSKDGVTDPARQIARFDVRSWTHLDPVASPGGRWLSWFGARDGRFLTDLEADREPIMMEGDDNLRAVYAFSADETECLVRTDGGFAVIALEAVGEAGREGASAVVHHLVESPRGRRRTLVLAAYPTAAHHWRRDDEETGLSRVAILYSNGDAEWWDLTAALPQRRPLPNVFSAFAAQMRVWNLEPHKVRAKLEFSPRGTGLLAAIAEASGEFGIAAHIDPAKGDGWKPVIVEHLKHQVHASTGRMSGGAAGPTSGYLLEDKKRLGAAHATWLNDEDLLTVGFDGTLEFHNLKRGASQFLSADVTTVADWNYMSRLGGISAGTSSGELRLIGEESSRPVFVLAGHDAPIAKVMRNIRGRRVVTVDKRDSARIWELTNPVMRPDLFQGVTDDWNRFYHGEREVRAWDPEASDPFLRPVGVMPDRPDPPFDETPNGDWAAVLDVSKDDPTALSVALYRRADEGFPEIPTAVRVPALPPDIELGEHWRWEPHGRLMVAGNRALFLVTGGALGSKGKGAFLVDLNDPAAAFVTVLHPKEGFKIKMVTDDLGRMLIARDDRHIKADERALEVRGVAARTGEEIFRLDGTPRGDLSGDGRWLVAKDTVFDLGGTVPVQRAARESPHGWPYRVEFQTGRPPLWLDKAGNLWGLDHASGAQSPPQMLASGLGLSAIGWATSGEWLGLGAANGEVRVVALGAGAGFDEIGEALASAALAPALPVSWDARARTKIVAIDLLPDAGWVSAQTRSSRFFLLWRGAPGAEWAEPVTLHASDGLRGEGDFACRPDGDLCVLRGQLLSFDETQLIAMSKPLLTESAAAR
jgi:hypothetical protein